MHTSTNLPPTTSYFHIWWSPSLIYNHWKSFKGHISKKYVKILKIDFSKFHRDNFKRDFKSVNWSVATQNNKYLKRFAKFLLIIDNLLNKQAKRKEKSRFKARITKGILTSIKQRDKICQQIIKVKNSQTKQLKFRLYKKYCNIFLDSAKLEIVWIKITTFFKWHVSIILWSFSRSEQTWWYLYKP